MKYPQPNDRYDCSVLCSNFMEIEERFDLQSDEIEKVRKESVVNSGGIVGKAEGKTIVVNDSAEAIPLSLSLYGESEQKQYSGKNLWSYGDISGTRNNGVSKPKLEPGTYTMSCLTTSSDTDYTKTMIDVWLIDDTHNYFEFERNVRTSKTFVTDKEIKQIIFYASNSYANSADDTFSFKDIQIEVGSVATDYEPFVGNQPSPSPSYPQEIESVEVGEIWTHRKNFQYNSATYDGWIATNTTFDEVVTAETYNGGKVLKYTIPWRYVQPPSKFFKAGTYTISFDAKTDVSTNSAIWVNGVGKAVTVGGTSWKRYSLTFTFDSDAKRRLALVIPTGQTIYSEIYIANIQIEEGSTATPYEPYTEKKITLSNPITLRRIGDAKDVLCKRDGVYGVLRRPKKFEFTSIRAFLNGTNTIRQFADVSDYVGGYNLSILCNRLIAKDIYSVDEAGIMLFNTGSGYVFVIRLPKSVLEAETEDAFLAYLQENVEAYYIAEPTFEPLPTADQIELSMFNPVTVITNDAGANMAVEYIADTNIYIDNLKAAHDADIQALKSAIEALGGTVG